MHTILENLFKLLLGDNLPHWLILLISMANILLIGLIAVVLGIIFKYFLNIINRKIIDSDMNEESKKRKKTLTRVIGYLLSILLGAITVMFMLSVFGISIAPIIAAAGVAGIAVGFGAQSLVKDYFTGVILLLENQIRIGDVIEIAGKTGTVESLTLRYVRLRDGNGYVHYVPNGVIATVTNKTLEFAYAVMDIGVPYSEDADRIMSIFKEIGDQMISSPAFSEKILAPIEIPGIQELADSAVIIRCRLKVMPMEQWPVQREFYRLAKIEFDKLGIGFPFPSRSLYIEKTTDK
jgi:moderate conductance mechanosensitive channel